ncbi:MAG: hypothetical protein ACRCV3_03930 [Desulfovibrionaceae bacterium]
MSRVKKAHKHREESAHAFHESYKKHALRKDVEKNSKKEKCFGDTVGKVSENEAKKAHNDIPTLGKDKAVPNTIDLSNTPYVEEDKEIRDSSSRTKTPARKVLKKVKEEKEESPSSLFAEAIPIRTNTGVTKMPEEMEKEQGALVPLNTTMERQSEEDFGIRSREKRMSETPLKPLQQLVQDIYTGIQIDQNIQTLHSHVYAEMRQQQHFPTGTLVDDIKLLLAQVDTLIKNKGAMDLSSWSDISWREYISVEDFYNFDAYNSKSPLYKQIHDDVIHNNNIHPEIDLTTIPGYVEHAHNPETLRSLYTLLNTLPETSYNTDELKAKLAAVTKNELFTYSNQGAHILLSEIEKTYLQSPAGVEMHSYRLPPPDPYTQYRFNRGKHWISDGICKLLTTAFVEHMNRSGSVYGEQKFKALLSNLDTVAQDPLYVRALHALNIDYQHIPKPMNNAAFFTHLVYHQVSKDTLVDRIFDIKAHSLKNQAFSLELNDLSHAMGLYREIVTNPYTGKKMVVIRLFDPNTGLYSFASAEELKDHLDRVTMLGYQKISDNMSLGYQDPEVLRMYGTRYKGVSYKDFIDNKFLNNNAFQIPLDQEPDREYTLRVSEYKTNGRFSLKLKDAADSLREMINYRLKLVHAKKNPDIQRNLKNIRTILNEIKRLKLIIATEDDLRTLRDKLRVETDNLDTEYEQSLGKYLEEFLEDIASEISERNTNNRFNALFAPNANAPAVNAPDSPGEGTSTGIRPFRPQTSNFSEKVIQELLHKVQNNVDDVKKEFDNLLKESSLEPEEILCPEIEDIIHSSQAIHEIEELLNKDHTEAVNINTGQTKNIALSPPFKQKVLQYLNTIKGVSSQMGGYALEGYSYYAAIKILLNSREYFERGKLFDKMTKIQQLRYVGEGVNNVLFLSSTSLAALNRLASVTVRASETIGRVSEIFGRAAMGVGVGLSALRVLEASKNLQEHPNYMANVEVGFAVADLTLDTIMAIAPETAIVLIPIELILGAVEEAVRRDEIAYEHKEYIKTLNNELKRRAEILMGDKVTFKDNLAIILGESGDITEVAMHGDKLAIGVHESSGVGYEAAGYFKNAIPCNRGHRRYGHNPRPEDGHKTIMYPRKSCVATKNVVQILHCRNAALWTEIKIANEPAISTVKEYSLSPNIEFIVLPIQHQYTITMQEISTYKAIYNHPDLLYSPLQQTYSYCSGFNPVVMAEDGGEVVNIPVSATMRSAKGPTVRTESFTRVTPFILQDASLNVVDDIKYETYTERVRVHKGNDNIRSHTHLHLYENIERQREVSRRKVYEKEVGHDFSIKMKISPSEYLLPQTHFIGNTKFPTYIYLNRGHYIGLQDTSDDNQGFVIVGYDSSNGDNIIPRLDIRNDGRIIIQILDSHDGGAGHGTYVDITSIRSSVVYMNTRGFSYQYNRTHKILEIINFDGSIINKKNKPVFDTSDDSATFMHSFMSREVNSKNYVFQLANLEINGKTHKEAFYFSHINRRNKPTVVYLNWPEGMEHADDYRLVHLEDYVVGHDAFDSVDVDNYVSYFYSPTDRRIIRQVRDNLIEEKDIILNDEEPQVILLTNGDRRLLLHGQTKGFNEHGELQEVYMDYTRLQEEDKAKLNELILKSSEDISSHENGHIIIENIPHSYKADTTTEDNITPSTASVQFLFTLKFNTKTGKALPILKNAFGVPIKLLTLSTTKSHDGNLYAYYFIKNNEMEEGNILAVKDVEMDLLADHKWLADTNLFLQGYRIFQDKAIKNAFSHQGEIFFETNDGAILKGSFDGKKDISYLVNLTEEYFTHYGLNLNNEEDIRRAFYQASFAYSKPQNTFTQIKHSKENTHGEIWYDHTALEVLRVHTELLNIVQHKEHQEIMEVNHTPSDFTEQKLTTPLKYHTLIGYIKKNDKTTVCIWEPSTKTYITLPETPSKNGNSECNIFPVQSVSISGDSAIITLDERRHPFEKVLLAPPVFPGVSKIFYQNIPENKNANKIYTYTFEELLSLEEITVDRHRSNTSNPYLRFDISLTSFAEIIPYRLVNDSNLYLRIPKSRQKYAPQEYFTLVMKDVITADNSLSESAPTQSLALKINGTYEIITTSVMQDLLSRAVVNRRVYFRNQEGKVERLFDLKNSHLSNQPLDTKYQRILKNIYETNNPLFDEQRSFNSTIDMQQNRQTLDNLETEKDVCQAIRDAFAQQHSSSENIVLDLSHRTELQNRILTIVGEKKGNQLLYKQSTLARVRLTKDNFESIFGNSTRCDNILYDPAMSFDYAKRHMTSHMEKEAVEPNELFPTFTPFQSTYRAPMYASTSRVSTIAKYEYYLKQEETKEQMTDIECPPVLNIMAENLTKYNTIAKNPIKKIEKIHSKIPLASSRSAFGQGFSPLLDKLMKYCPTTRIINLQALFYQFLGNKQKKILPISHILEGFDIMLDSKTSPPIIYIIYPDTPIVTNTKLTALLERYVKELKRQGYSIIVDTHNTLLEGSDPLKQLSASHNNIHIVRSMEEALEKGLFAEEKQ